MNRHRLRLQAAGILVPITLIGWPQFRSVRAISVWRTAGPLMPRPELVADDVRIVDAQSESGIVQVGFGSLANKTRSPQRPRRLANESDADNVADYEELASLKAKWNALTCLTRTSIDKPVPFARLVLRDAVTGRIEARATADEAGRCAFVDLAPGSYLLELLDSRGTVIASSELVSMANDELREAILTVGSDATVGAIFGSVEPGAADAVNGAVETGTPAVAQPAATNSPQQ